MKQKAFQFLSIITSYILLSTSCSYNNKEIRDAHISSNSSKEIQTLNAKEIYLNEVFDVSDMAIEKDNIIFQSISADTIIHIYQTPNFELLNKFGHKGEGPMEFSNPRLYKSTNDQLLIGGFNRGKTAYRYNLNNNNIDKQNQYDILNTGDPMNNVYSFNDHLIYNNIFQLNICKYNFENNSTDIIYSFSKDDHPESFLYSNKGILVANDSVMAYAYFYKDQIDLIDLKGNLKKSIVGEKQKPHINTNDFKSNTITFVNAFASKSYIFLLYRGKTHDDFIKSPYDDKVMIYDNQGNYINEYKFNIPPILFVFDEVNNILYGYNGLYKECILSYDVKI